MTPIERIAATIAPELHARRHEPGYRDSWELWTTDVAEVARLITDDHVSALEEVGETSAAAFLRDLTDGHPPADNVIHMPRRHA